MSAIETMTCDWCGKKFPADARACVESGLDVEIIEVVREEWRGGKLTINPEEIPLKQRKRMMEDTGLTNSQLNYLLSTGRVSGLGAIICIQCQDEAEDDDDED